MRFLLQRELRCEVELAVGLAQRAAPAACGPRSAAPAAHGEAEGGTPALERSRQDSGFFELL